MNRTESEKLALELRNQFEPLLQGYSSLQDAFQLNDEKIRQLTAMGNELARQGKLNDAALILGGLTLIRPETALLHSSLGAVLMKMKQNESAFSELSYAVELDPTDIGARVNLGELSCQLGDVNAAVQHLEQAILLDPSAQNPFANRARSLLLLISNTARELRNQRPEKIKEQLRSLPSM